MQFPRKVDILDQNAFDFDTPSSCDFSDDFLNALSDFFTSFNDILEDSGTKNVTKSSLSTFDKSSADTTDAESCLVRIDNVVVDDRGDVDVDVVFGHTYLRRNFDDGNLDVDLLQFLGQRIDFAQTRVDSTVVFSEFQDETGLTFVDCNQSTLDFNCSRYLACKDWGNRYNMGWIPKYRSSLPICQSSFRTIPD